ncbi:hypothetical protein H2200_012352 [Cladophialophora chaetospira]|uniref:DUF2415 domain-containing protein n=1 Tax=Cladophialophora chaetospira TaxID=386627 RepID=A0AA38WXR5_9EURO|nr:hypothetical protein H2200_012352 [Cladophialophora chaetospira]
MTRASRELWLTPTESLAAHHKFYPTKIQVAHHQLRHLISSAEKDLIYYISQRDVYVLDLATNQNSLIATVPFDSRCLAADLGWVCVGGEQNGDCAFIKVEKDEHDRPICFGHDFNHDLLGGEIVNSMSIHTILNHGKTPDEPVVLISNNDKTVKIYSLAQREVLTTLSHAVPMNFAAMSPDSSIIAAVGDSDRVYFYRRRLYQDPDIIDGSCGRYAKYEWDSLIEPQVPTGEPVYDDYSFAVSFSPSGHLCAASSQGGSILVFDMKHLLNNDESTGSSILCSFRSSRAQLFGCVRSMTFSPAPWDLLVWAEDHGKIGVADIRQGCVRRQILELDRQKAEEIKLEDGTPVSYRNISHKEKIKQQHLTRLRAMRGLSSTSELDGELNIDDLPTEPARRYTRQDLISYRSLDLDARERSVIEALETTMDNVEQPPARPYSINYTSSPRWFASRIPAEATPPSPGSGRPNISRNQLPRRRSSVVLSESTVNAGRYLDVTDGHRARLSASPGRIGDDDDIPTMSTNDLTPSASGSTSQPTPSNIPPNDPWHVIQTALETARETDTSNRANLARIEAALEAERQLGNQLERQLNDERQLSLLLRRQLDTQQRLLVENSNQLEHLRAAARESNARVEASLERVLQRQLAHEQHFLNQRAEELQSELRAGTDYSRRLESERDRLLTNDSGTTASDSRSARTTTLPTTNVRPSEIANVLTDYSETRRERLAHIENLQRQVRRAESRVALAAIDIQALENAIRREMGVEELSRPRAPDYQTSDNTRRTITSTANDPSRPVPPHAGPVREPELINRPSTVNPGGPMLRTPFPPANRGAAGTRQPASELAGRVPDADMRLARMMFLSGMSGNRSLDANGNWLPPGAGAGLHRVLGAGASGSRVAAGAVAPVDVNGLELGTTGIGFSEDGQFLYAGTEQGIFEFKVNVRDRMTFPAFEMSLQPDRSDQARVPLDRSVPLGTYTNKPRIDKADLGALVLSAVCFVAAVCVVSPGTGVPWQLGVDLQIIVLGFLLGVMNVCMQVIVPTALLLYEARFGHSILQNYDAIVCRSFTRRHTSLYVRVVLSALICLPLGLGVAYKTFRGGSSTHTFTLHAQVDRSYSPQRPSLRCGYSFGATVADFMQQTSFPNNEKVLARGFPVGFGPNILLLDTSAAAALDLPNESYLAAMRAQINSDETLMVSATVNAFVTRHDPSFESKRHDDEFWEDTFSYASAIDNGRALTSFTMYSGYLTTGFIRFVPQDGFNISCLWAFYNGSSPAGGSTDPVGFFRSETDDESLLFRQQASRYNTTRARCTATWWLNQTDIKLVPGSCRDNEKANSPTNSLSFYEWIAPPPFEYPPLQGGMARFRWNNTRNSVAWRIPSDVSILAAAYSDRASKMLDSILYGLRENLPEPISSIAVQSLNYTDSNERLVSARPILRPSGLLYLVLAVYPLITLCSFILNMTSYDVPVSAGFGIVSMLAGARHEDLAILSGASISGQLKKRVEVDFSGRENPRRDTVDTKTGSSVVEVSWGILSTGGADMQYTLIPRRSKSVRGEMRGRESGQGRGTRADTLLNSNDSWQRSEGYA